MSAANKRKVPKGVWVVSVLLGILLVAVYARHVRTRETKEPRHVVTVRRGDIQTVVTAAGAVMPHNRIVVRSPMACRVEDVSVVEGAHVDAGQVVATVSSPERAALLNAASRKGEAELQRWQDIYKTIPLTTPIAGTVLACPVRAGQAVSPEMELVVVSDRLVVKAYVDETDIGDLAVGKVAEVTLDACPGGQFAASVDRIALEAKTRNGLSTYEVELTGTNMPLAARSGMSATVAFTIVARKDVLVLPRAAVSLEDGRTVVRASTDGQESVTREVQTGLKREDDVEITGGLREGDSVLAVGFEEVPDGRRSAASPLLPSFTGRTGS